MMSLRIPAIQHGLGQFIHWGVYAIPVGFWEGKCYPGAAEWIRSWKEMPKDAYELHAAREWMPVLSVLVPKGALTEIKIKYKNTFSCFRSF